MYSLLPIVFRRNMLGAFVVAPAAAPRLSLASALGGRSCQVIDARVALSARLSSPPLRETIRLAASVGGRELELSQQEVVALSICKNISRLPRDGSVSGREICGNFVELLNHRRWHMLKNKSHSPSNYRPPQAPQLEEEAEKKVCNKLIFKMSRRHQ